MTSEPLIPRVEWREISQLPGYEINKAGNVRNKITRLPIRHRQDDTATPYILLYIEDEKLRKNFPISYYVETLLKETFPDEA